MTKTMGKCYLKLIMPVACQTCIGIGLEIKALRKSGAMPLKTKKLFEPVVTSIHMKYEASSFSFRQGY